MNTYISNALFTVNEQHYVAYLLYMLITMGFAVRVRCAGQKYGPTCHQRDRADVTEFVTLVRLSSLGQHVGVLALAGYKRRKSALTAGPIASLYCMYYHNKRGRHSISLATVMHIEEVP